MISIEKLSINYNRNIFKNYSIYFDKGINVIVGKSGSGKSTLLKVIAGVKRKYKGEVSYYLNNINDIDGYTFKYVSYVYQDYQLFDDLTVIENILLPSKMISKESSNDLFKAKALLKEFHLANIDNKKVSELSGGEKQRVAIIRSLIKDSEIYLFDEPTSALDEENTKIFVELVTRLKEKIVIIITHDLSLANNFDKIINLDKKENKKIEVSKKQLEKKKVVFSNISLLYKKVFKGKKIYRYIATSILSFGLMCFNISFLVADIVNEITSDALNIIDVSGVYTFKSKNEVSKVDFYKENIDGTYYEGFKNEIKDELKEMIKDETISINNLELVERDFIIDNYMAEDDKFTLAIPIIYKPWMKQENYLIIGSYKIKIDKYIYSNKTCIYCNSTNYLKEYLKSRGITYENDCYIISQSIENCYQSLISDDKYLAYSFYLFKDDYLIKVIENTENRIKNTIDGCIYADNYNTYIDYYLGYSYLIVNQTPYRVIIDEEVEDFFFNSSNIDFNKIIIGEKKINLSKKIDNSYPLLYMNSTTYNYLGNGMAYTGISFKKIENDDLRINHIDRKTNFKVFDYFYKFILLFSLLVIVLAIIAFIKTFEVNIKNKKRDIKALYYLGIYQKVIKRMLLYESIFNLFYSFLISLFVVLLTSYLLNKLSPILLNVKLNTSINIYALLLSFFVLLLIYAFLLLFLSNFVKKEIVE